MQVNYEAKILKINFGHTTTLWDLCVVGLGFISRNNFLCVHTLYKLLSNSNDSMLFYFSCDGELKSP